MSLPKPATPLKWATIQRRHNLYSCLILCGAGVHPEPLCGAAGVHWQQVRAHQRCHRNGGPPRVCLSVCLCVCLSVFLSFWLTIRPFVCLLSAICLSSLCFCLPFFYSWLFSFPFVSQSFACLSLWPLSVSLFFLSFRLPVCLSLSVFRLSLCPSVFRLSACLSVCLFFCFPICPPIYRPACLPICLPLCQSV
jgi:hypothetical protein